MNTTLDKQATMNPNIIRKWCLSLKNHLVVPNQIVYEKEAFFERFKTCAIFRRSFKGLKQIFEP